jgi:hypothetical protein
MSAKSATLDKEMVAWLRRVCAAETPPASVIAFNIGLFETEDGFSAYLVGAERYDANDGDWACNEAFTARERYLALPLGHDAKWQRVLELVVDAVRRFLASTEGAASFLARARAVTVGFDDGDLVRVR